MKAVIDTNVIISALLWGGQPRRVIDYARSGHYHALTSPALLAELKRVLSQRFALPQARVEMALRSTLSYSEMILPVEEIETPVRDPGDIKVIACAIAGGADIIITGDRDLLDLVQVGGIRIVSVSEFLAGRVS